MNTSAPAPNDELIPLITEENAINATNERQLIVEVFPQENPPQNRKFTPPPSPVPGLRCFNTAADVWGPLPLPAVKVSKLASFFTCTYSILTTHFSRTWSWTRTLAISMPMLAFQTCKRIYAGNSGISMNSPREDIWTPHHWKLGKWILRSWQTITPGMLLSVPAFRQNMARPLTLA
jgi:hypothetical protein